MTLRSKLPLHLYQKYYLAKDSFDSFLDKLQVVADNNAIVYSIRILIVVLALLLGYVQTPKEGKTFSSMEKNELVSPKTKSIIEQIK
jgi:hypothetical protein